MNLQPAYDVTLTHGGNTVRLVPSLRAATYLERLHGGFEALFTKIDQFDTATIKAVIRISATNPAAADAYLSAIKDAPLGTLSASTHAQLTTLCSGLIPTPPKDAKAAKEPMPWAEVYQRLFQIATGWLGWPPATAWAATPDEIAQAFDGKTDMLQAIHGKPDDQNTSGPDAKQRAENEALGLDPDFDRAALQALKAELG